MTPRQLKAMNLVASGAVSDLVAVGPEHVLVPSATCEGAFYVTSVSDCTCPDFTFKPELPAICKHVIAIRLQRVLDACKESSS